MSKFLMARLALASATPRLLGGIMECVRNPVWLALIVAGPIMARWPSPQIPQSSFTPPVATASSASAQATTAQSIQAPAAQQVSAPAGQPLQQPAAAAPVVQPAAPVASAQTAPAGVPAGLPTGAVIMQPSGSAPLRLPGSVLPSNSGADIQLVLPQQDQVQSGLGSGDFGVARRAR